LISHGAGLPQHRGQIRPAQRLSESRSTGWTNNGRSRSAARRRQVRAAQRTKTRASAHPPWQRTVKSNRRQVAIADQTASRRSPCERSPRTVAGLVPVPWLISIAGLVKVSVVTPAIIARSVGTRHDSRGGARFLALRFRSRRGIGRDCYSIGERLSREHILHCGSLRERGCTGRTLRCRGRSKLDWLRTSPWRARSFLFSVLHFIGRFDLVRRRRLLRRD
jgi:hypothetical protein